MAKSRIILSAALVILAGLTALAGCRSAFTTSAILYIDEQNYDKAVEVIQEGFQYRDDEPDAYYYLGEAYSHLGENAVEDDNFDEAKKNYQLAYEAYEKALKLDADKFGSLVRKSLKYNYQNRLRQAQLDWKDGYYEQAEGHFRLAYAALPDSLAPIKDIARMKMQMSNEDSLASQKTELLQEALSLLDQVLAKKSDAYDLKVDKANVLSALGHKDEAEAIFNELLRDHGDDTQLLTDMANLAIDKGDYEKAADYYVKIVDLNENDTDASNDANNKAMLVAAGTWYGTANIGRYEDAIKVLDRAANLEIIPTADTMLSRLRTYYNYGKKLKGDAAAATDPVEKKDLDEKSKAMLNRAVEIGVAMTNQFVANADGFFYLSLAQLELGDFSASEANYKTYQELSGANAGQ